MKIFVEWHPDEGVAEIRYDGVEIRTHTDFAAWRDQVVDGLAKIRAQVGGTFPLVVGIDGIRIHKQVSDDYSELAKAVAGEYASAIARYGEAQPLTGAVIAISAMRRALESDAAPPKAGGANLFADRASAVAFVTS